MTIHIQLRWRNSFNRSVSPSIRVSRSSTHSQWHTISRASFVNAFKSFRRSTLIHALLHKSSQRLLPSPFDLSILYTLSNSSRSGPHFCSIQSFVSRIRVNNLRLSPRARSHAFFLSLHASSNLFISDKIARSRGLFFFSVFSSPAFVFRVSSASTPPTAGRFLVPGETVFGSDSSALSSTFLSTTTLASATLSMVFPVFARVPTERQNAATLFISRPLDVDAWGRDVNGDVRDAALEIGRDDDVEGGAVTWTSRRPERYKRRGCRLEPQSISRTVERLR